MSDKIRNLTPRCALIQAFYWMGFSTVSAFSSAYLLKAGLTSGAIGLMLALASLTSALIQPLVAAYADRPESLSLRHILILLSLLSVAFGAVLAVNQRRSLLLSVVLYFLAILILQLLQPLINALGMACVNQGSRLNYGTARAFGSIGYAAASWILGRLVAGFSADILPLSVMICFGLLALCSWLFPFRKDRAVGNAGKRQAAGENPFLFLIRHRRFSLMLVGMVLMYISHSLLNLFLLQIMGSKGGGSAEMGTALAIAACMELPIMFFFTKVVKVISSRTLVRLSPFFFFLQTLLSLLVPNVSAYYAVQVCKLFGYATFCISSVYYVNEIMGEADVAKGQAYAMMTYSIASVIASFAGGALIDAAGVGSMLLFGVISSAAGALIIFFSAPKSAVK